MSKNRFAPTDTTTADENLVSGDQVLKDDEQPLDTNTQVGGEGESEQPLDTNPQGEEPSNAELGELVDGTMMPPDDPPTGDQGIQDQSAPAAEPAVQVQAAPVAAVQDTTVAATVSETPEWTELRAQVMAKELPAVNRLIAVLETFEAELGNNSTYGNPSMFEAGASKTFSMYSRLIAAINDVPATEVRVAWYTLLGFIRNHQKRYDAYSPMMLFRFQPYWSHGSESAKEFEMFMTTVIESSKSNLAEVGKTYPVAKHLAPLSQSAAAAVLALYA